MSSVITGVTESTTDMNTTPAMEADATSGKTNICKNFIKMN